MALYRNHNRREVLLSSYYAAHISAMTTEKLFGKAEIAEELAIRDKKIEELDRLVIELDRKLNG